MIYHYLPEATNCFRTVYDHFGIQPPTELIDLPLVIALQDFTRVTNLHQAVAVAVLTEDNQPDGTPFEVIRHMGWLEGKDNSVWHQPGKNAPLINESIGTAMTPYIEDREVDELIYLAIKPKSD
jgi:hypothetical protein